LIPLRRHKIAALPVAKRFDSATKPIGFIGETIGTRDAFEGAVTCDHVEADAPLQLAQTNGTEMQRTTIAFSQVIRAVHEAIEINAMGEPEHVTGLMREHFAAPAKQKSRGCGIARRASRSRGIKRGIVPRKTVNADTPAQRSLAAN